MILFRVCFGSLVAGREKSAISGGLLPRWVVELKSERFVHEFFPTVPINEACLEPTIELIKFAL